MSDILELLYYSEVRVNSVYADEFVELATRLGLRGFSELNAGAVKQAELNRKLSQNGNKNGNHQNGNQNGNQNGSRNGSQNGGQNGNMNGKSPHAITMKSTPVIDPTDCEGGGEMQYKRSPNGKCVEEKLRAIRSDAMLIGSTVAIGHESDSGSETNF